MWVLHWSSFPKCLQFGGNHLFKTNVFSFKVVVSCLGTGQALWLVFSCRCLQKGHLSLLGAFLSFFLATLHNQCHENWLSGTTDLCACNLQHLYINFLLEHFGPEGPWDKGHGFFSEHFLFSDPMFFLPKVKNTHVGQQIARFDACCVGAKDGATVMMW